MREAFADGTILGDDREPARTDAVSWCFETESVRRIFDIGRGRELKLFASGNTLSSVLHQAVYLGVTDAAIAPTQKSGWFEGAKITFNSK